MWIELKDCLINSKFINKVTKLKKQYDDEKMYAIEIINEETKHSDLFEYNIKEERDVEYEYIKKCLFKEDK